MRRLAGAVRRARLALLWERAWPRLVPLLTLVGLFVAVSWLGLWRVVPDMARVGLLAAFALAALAALVPLIRLTLPGDAEAVKRVERVSALDHRPASGLRDRLSPVSDDAGAKALWAAHRLRLLAAIGSLRAGAPRPELIRRDPNALRFLVPVALIVAFAMASGEHLLRLQEAFMPVERGAAAAPVRVDAWIDPPAYTGQPPVFLSRRESGGGAVAVPEASQLTVRVVSEEPVEVALETADGAEALEPEEGGTGTAAPASGEAAVEPQAAPGGAIRTYRAELGADGSVAIRNGGEETRYGFSIIEDRPPTISRGAVTVNRTGSFAMEFAVADDYGVTGGTVTFKPKNEPEGARPLVDAPQVPLRLSRSERREGTARADARIGDHPFAGLEVEADAVAVDAAGQEGRAAEDGTMTLPARPFRNPIARALVEQRQILAQDARAQGRVAMAIEALTLWPERFIDDAGIYLGLVVAHRRLVTAETDDQLREMLDYLWTMARTIEDGILSEAEERLNAAREALEQALAEGASEEEIARLMDELRQAMNEYLQSMMQEMARQGGELPELPMSPDMQMLSQRDLDRMLDRIEELARMGDMESAQALLNQLQQMLDNLQMAQRGQMDGEAGEMMQMMEEIARLMREQQQLMDDTFSLDQGQRPRGQGQQQGQPQQGSQGPLSPSEMAEIMRQLQQGQSDLHQGLQQLLEQLRQGQMGSQGQPMPGQGENPGERALGRAGRSMDDAARSLGQGQTGPAYGQQGQALEALREGLQGMMEQMFGQQGQGGPQQFGQGNPNGRTDPLGRPQRTEGPDLGLDVEVPDEIDVERARRILNAIRERLGERFRPRFELDYLERLLNGQ